MAARWPGFGDATTQPASGCNHRGYCRLGSHQMEDSARNGPAPSPPLPCALRGRRRRQVTSCHPAHAPRITLGLRRVRSARPPPESRNALRSHLHLTICDARYLIVVDETFLLYACVMKHYDSMTQAMTFALRAWSTYGATCWVTFDSNEEKLDGLRAKLDEAYGLALPPEKRRWRRSKKLPVAWGFSTRVLGKPHSISVLMLATQEAVSAPPESPFSREKWRTSLPELGDFVMVKEPRERGDYAWSWKIQDRQMGLMSAHLTALVKHGDTHQLAACCHEWARLYPAFGGVRRGLKRLFKSAAKLWVATHKKPWPGPDPEQLPMMVGFKA